MADGPQLCFEDMAPKRHWFVTADGDPDVRTVFDRHYSRQRYADGRKPKLLVGPGEKMVLRTARCDAIFAWRKFISADGQDGINCAIFRNESPVLSSILLIEAEDYAFERWPDEKRLFTYVNPRKVRSPNPGFCFLKAGWNRCGRTKWNDLLILEKIVP